MNLSALRRRVDALLAKVPPPPVVENAIPDGPQFPEPVERALITELFRQHRALSEAAVGAPGLTTADAWRFVEEDFEVLDHAGRIDSTLAKQMLGLGRALENDGLLVVRRANGRLSPSDIRAKREAEAQGRPTYTLPYVSPIEHLAIDIKAELMAEAVREKSEVPYRKSVAGQETGGQEESI